MFQHYELLLEDIWTLLRAGRLEEASELCCSAGQAWRAATLCPFGGIDMFPSLDALLKNGKSKTIQAIELEGGVGQQWRLWKWASYCASEVNSRVCFFLFDIVLYMFKNSSDFSLTSLLWYTHLEYCYFRKYMNKMVVIMRWLYMLYSAVT